MGNRTDVECKRYGRYRIEYLGRPDPRPNGSTLRVVPAGQARQLIARGSLGGPEGHDKRDEEHGRDRERGDEPQLVERRNDDER